MSTSIVFLLFSFSFFNYKLAALSLIYFLFSTFVRKKY